MSRVLVVLCGLLVLLVPSAQAQERCEAPPGTAAIDQYCERVPDVGGERDPSSASSSSSRDREQAAQPDGATLDQLRDRGEDGRALADAVGGSGDGPDAGSGGGSSGGAGGDAGGGGGNSGGGSGGVSGSSEPAPSASPVDAVGSAVGNGATLGSALPWTLLAIAVAMAGVLWVRLRAGRPGPDPVD